MCEISSLRWARIRTIVAAVQINSLDLQLIHWEIHTTLPVVQYLASIRTVWMLGKRKGMYR